MQLRPGCVQAAFRLRPGCVQAAFRLRLIAPADSSRLITRYHPVGTEPEVDVSIFFAIQMVLASPKLCLSALTRLLGGNEQRRAKRRDSSL